MPGDVVRVRLGDVIPADLRVLDDVSLQVDQSALTGESLAVTRGGRGGQPLYSGSVLVRGGEADAVVYATGASSYFGRTAALVQTAGTISHFQRAVLRIGHYLIVLAVALVVLTTVVSLIRGNAVLETLEFALVVTIASIPVALPAVLSVTMAVGGAQTRPAASGGEPLAGHRGIGRHGPAVLRQDRHAHPEPAGSRRGFFGPPTEFSEQTLLATAALASRAEDNDPPSISRYWPVRFRFRRPKYRCSSRSTRSASEPKRRCATFPASSSA